MTRKIVEELIPIKKGLHQFAERVEEREKLVTGMNRDEPKSSNNLSDLGPYTRSFISKYMDSELKSQRIDTTFGIRYDYKTGKWNIGNKAVKLQADDSMQVGDEHYRGTPGFWNLVTNKDPDANYTGDDYERYRELLWETSALHQNYDPWNPYPRASGSKKWKKFLSSIWNEFQSEGLLPDDGEG